MSEPKRWLDDEGAPRDAVQMLRALRPPRPMPARKRAALAGILVGLAAQTPRVASGMLWLKAALISTAVVGVGSTGYFIAHRANHPLAVSKESALHTPVEISPQAQPTPEVPAVEPAPAVAPQPQAAPAVSEKARGDTLADEEALLEEARRTLASSPSQALKLLRQHKQRFPHGQLTAERLFLSADAFARAGDKASAERQAKALLEQFPTSAYARRLPALLGTPPPP